MCPLLRSVDTVLCVHILATTVVGFINVICEILTFNCTKMRLAAGLCPDLLGELTVLPRPPGWILGVQAGKGGEGKAGVERGGEGRKVTRSLCSFSQC